MKTLEDVLRYYGKYHHDVMNRETVLHGLTINEAKETIYNDLVAMMPIRQGGAAIGRNYWSGVAKGNNDTLDEMQEAIKRYCGVLK